MSNINLILLDMCLSGIKPDFVSSMTMYYPFTFIWLILKQLFYNHCLTMLLDANYLIKYDFYLAW